MPLPGSALPIRIEFQENSPQNVDFGNLLSQNTGFLKIRVQKSALFYQLSRPIFKNTLFFRSLALQISNSRKLSLTLMRRSAIWHALAATASESAQTALSIRIPMVPMRLPAAALPMRIEFYEFSPRNVDFRNSLSQNTGFLKTGVQKHDVF